MRKLSRFILDSAIHWDSATFELCNLAYTNGADPGANYNQMQQDLVVCKAGAGSHRPGSFFVGAELFNAQEMQTININNPDLALQRLDHCTRVRFDRFACLNQHCLYFVLRVKGAEPEKNQLNRFFHTEIFN
jgi:hypothetical protein